MDSDDACIRCGIRFVEGPVRDRNPLPARVALIFAVIGAVAGQQLYKVKNPIRRTGIDIYQAAWAGAGGALFGSIGFAFGAAVSGRRKPDPV